MAKKFKTLLDINTIIKQRVEKKLADLVKQGEAIKCEIETIETAIHAQKTMTKTQTQSDPLSFNLFAEWEDAQRRKIERLQKEVAAITERQMPLRQDLASIFIKEKVLKSKLELEKKEQALKMQEDRAEKTQAVWLQDNYNSA